MEFQYVWEKKVIKQNKQETSQSVPSNKNQSQDDSIRLYFEP